MTKDFKIRLDTENQIRPDRNVTGKAHLIFDDPKTVQSFLRAPNPCEELESRAGRAPRVPNPCEEAESRNLRVPQATNPCGDMGQWTQSASEAFIDRKMKATETRALSLEEQLYRFTVNQALDGNY